MSDKADSRERILAAAIEMFAEKGKHGVRMEEIAAKAEINKAMLYYYYSTRENLYKEVVTLVMSSIINRMSKNLQNIIDSEDDHIEKTKKLIYTYFDVFSDNQAYTKVVHSALINEPDLLEEAIHKFDKGYSADPRRRMIDFYEDGMRKGILRRTDPLQLDMSITALSMYYFMMRPLAKVFLNAENKDEKEFLKERQESVIDLVLNGIINR